MKQRQPKLFRSPLPIIWAAAFLSVLSPAKICFGAEVTFSGRYSLQLPASWAGTLQPDKSFVGQSADGVSFGFKAYPSDVSPEEYMAKALSNTEQRAGYKLIEKTEVKSSTGHKAQRVRYQTDGKNGAESAVKYYFQLADKEVVVLLFSWLASNMSKSPKADIETIFDSVKVAPATSKEDSWVDSSAGPAATPAAPAAPNTAGTPIIFANNCSVELPAGWTGKAAGTHLEAKGPQGTILDGFSVKGAMSVDSAINDLVTMFGKTFPGFKLLETAEVVTRAGAKGKALRYRSDGKTGSQSDLGLCVIIKAAENQIVTLRFATPDAPPGVPEFLMDGVHAIYRSLNLTSSDAPAQKSSRNADASGADDTERALQILRSMKLAGKYVHQKVPTNYIVLNADGTFAFHLNGETHTGPYTSDDRTVTLKYAEGDSDTARLEKNALVDKNGDRWVKKP